MLYEDLIGLRELRDKPQNLQNSHIRGVHRLGEKLGPTNIIYFGQDKTEKQQKNREKIEIGRTMIFCKIKRIGKIAL